MAWEEINDYGIGVVWLAVALGIASRATIRLPYTAVLLLAGLVIGLTLHAAASASGNGVGAWSNTLFKWVNMDSIVIGLVFLPLLIFHSAFGIDVHVFRRELWQVLSLAAPGVAAATALTATLLHFILPHDWGWLFSLMAASILCATDPVAATALLGDSGVAERLTVLIQGAALLAAGTSTAFFTAFSEAATGSDGAQASEIAKDLCRLLLGGPLVGLGVGVVLLAALGRMTDDAMSAVTLSVAACFAAYVAAETTELQVSGLLAVITLGLMLGAHVAGRVSPNAEEGMRTLWAMASYMGNAVVFFDAGLLVGNRALYSSDVGAKEWGYLVLLFLLLQAVRAIMVLLCSPVLVLGGYKVERRELPVLAFAGVRGAVGLALAITASELEGLDPVNRELVLFYTTGVSALSLFVNGMLMGPLLRALQMDRATLAETEVFVRACTALELRVAHKVDQLKADRFVGDADWQLVWRYIPVMTSSTYWTRIRHGNIALSEAEQSDIIAFDRNNLRTSLRAWESGTLSRAVVAVCWQGPPWSAYAQLPPRLRRPWFEYHRLFSRGGRSDVAEELSLHRLNSGPQVAGPQLTATQKIFPLGNAASAANENDPNLSGAGVQNSAALAVAEMARLRVERDFAVRALGQAVERLHQAERDADKAAADDDEQLLPSSDSLMTLHSHSHSSAKPNKQRRRQQDNGGAGGSGGVGFAGQHHYSDGGHNTTKGDESGSETSETSMDLVRALQETRARLLSAVKANYQERYRKGWLSSSGLRVLRDNVDGQMDHKAWGLDHWAKLHDSFTLPARPLALVRRLPLLGQLVEPYIYRRLAFVFELASNFISAHEDVDILDFIREGPVAYQLAYEKNRQLSEARETLAKQLPVFPELARALKTEVAARYLLVRHRRTIDEFYSHGLINDKEKERLIHENNASRVRLDYHPRADGIPDRYELLRDVPFLVLLDEEDKAAVIGNEKVCHEEFYSSGVELMRELAGRSRGHDRSGWFVVVRGSVRQITVEERDAQGGGGTNERLLHAGTVFGLDGQLLDTPYRSTYITASFAHVFFFDRQQTLQLAEKLPELKRGLWVTLAASVVRYMPGFRRMALEDIHELMCDGELVELRRNALSSAATMDALPGAARPSRSRRRSNTSTEGGSSARRRDSLTPTGARNNRLTVKSLSRARLGDLDDYKRDVTAAASAAASSQAAAAAAAAAAHKISVPEGSQVLLLRGKMYGSADALRLPAPDEVREGVCRIRDKHGPLLFSEDSVFFVLSGMIMQRTSSGHELLSNSESNLPSLQGGSPPEDAEALRRTRLLRDTHMAARAGSGGGGGGGGGPNSGGNGGGGGIMMRNDPLQLGMDGIGGLMLMGGDLFDSSQEGSSRRGSAYTRKRGSGFGRDALVELHATSPDDPDREEMLSSPEDFGERHWAHSPESLLPRVGEIAVDELIAEEYQTRQGSERQQKKEKQQQKQPRRRQASERSEPPPPPPPQQQQQQQQPQQPQPQPQQQRVAMSPSICENDSEEEGAGVPKQGLGPYEERMQMRSQQERVVVEDVQQRAHRHSLSELDKQAMSSAEEDGLVF